MGGRCKVCFEEAVSVDMYKRSVKDRVRWMSDNVSRRYPAGYR